MMLGSVERGSKSLIPKKGGGVVSCRYSGFTAEKKKHSLTAGNRSLAKKAGNLAPWFDPVAGRKNGRFWQDVKLPKKLHKTLMEMDRQNIFYLEKKEAKLETCQLQHLTRFLWQLR